MQIDLKKLKEMAYVAVQNELFSEYGIQGEHKPSDYDVEDRLEEYRQVAGAVLDMVKDYYGGGIMHKHVPMELPATGNPNIFSINKEIGEFVQEKPLSMEDPNVVAMVRVCANCHLLYVEFKHPEEWPLKTD